MIKQIKTKNKVVIDPISREEAYVILTLNMIEWAGNVFHASSYYQVENTSNIIHKASVSFTNEEADQLFAYFEIPQGTFTEMFIDLATQTMMAEIEKEKFFGLSASDWEDYIPPVIDENID
jgi:hypothetical protein